PGRPLVSQGVEIQTVRPRFASSTRVMANPGNFVVRMHFGHEGKLQSHQVLQSTGVPDVDRSTLDALYQWRAVGPVIDALKEPATMTIDVRILYRD
ncbi:MAG: TonB family protein, partial [Phycisphaerales bacterium]|nr:TonB family protein [Phycisphaerales bacterium]